MDRDDLVDWLNAYGHAWQQRDADAVIRLFSTDAVYYETPYAEPFQGHAGIAAYWKRATADQDGIEFDSDALCMISPGTNSPESIGPGTNEETGVARWSARFTAVSTGAKLELNGVFLLKFNADGLCTDLREWWHLR